MKIAILDGQPLATEERYNGYLSSLAVRLEQKGHSVKTLILRDLDIKFCTGCWSCWWGTPGECVFKDDSHMVCREYINSDFVLFASPMIMGFSSALLKKAQDKLIPLLHPYFDFVQGESHHRKRYDAYPRIGVVLDKTPGTDGEDIEITVDMFKRFSLNFRTDLVLHAMTSQSVEEGSDAINRI